MSWAQVLQGSAVAQGQGHSLDVQLDVQGLLWNVTLGFWVLFAHYFEIARVNIGSSVNKSESC